MPERLGGSQKFIGQTSKLTVSKKLEKIFLCKHLRCRNDKEWSGNLLRSRDIDQVLQCALKLLWSGLGAHSLVVFCFGVREDVRLQVS